MAGQCSQGTEIKRELEAGICAGLSVAGACVGVSVAGVFVGVSVTGACRGECGWGLGW